MKKLILLCFALLVGALQIVAQTTKTVTIDFSKPDGTVKYQVMTASGLYATEYTKSNLTTEVASLGCLIKDNVKITFDFQNATATTNKSKWTQNGTLDLYSGVGMTISIDNAAIKINKVVFKRPTPINGSGIDYEVYNLMHVRKLTKYAAKNGKFCQGTVHKDSVSWNRGDQKCIDTYNCLAIGENNLMFLTRKQEYNSAGTTPVFTPFYNAGGTSAGSTNPIYSVSSIEIEYTEYPTLLKAALFGRTSKMKAYSMLSDLGAKPLYATTTSSWSDATIDKLGRLVSGEMADGVISDAVEIDFDYSEIGRTDGYGAKVYKGGNIQGFSGIKFVVKGTDNGKKIHRVCFKASGKTAATNIKDNIRLSASQPGVLKNELSEASDSIFTVWYSEEGAESVSLYLPATGCKGLNGVVIADPATTLAIVSPEIEVIYSEEAAKLPKHVGLPKVYCDQYKVGTTTQPIPDKRYNLTYSGAANITSFGKADDCEAGVNPTFFYYITNGLEDNPLEKIDDDKWVQWNAKSISIPGTCRFYYCAADPDFPEVKNEMGYVEFTRLPEHTIFDLANNSVGGKLKIWSETAPTGKDWAVGDQHKNIRRMVYVLGESEDYMPDAFIIDFIPDAYGKTANIGASYLAVEKGAQFKVRTQFDALRMNQVSFASDANDTTNDYLKFTEASEGFANKWSTGAVKERLYSCSNNSLLFTSTGGVFKKLSIRWTPRDYNSGLIPSAPVATLINGSDEGGLVRFVDAVDLYIDAQQGNVTYEFTTDATQSEIKSGKPAYPGEKITINVAQFGESTTGRLLMKSDYYTDGKATSVISQKFFQPVQAQGFSALSELISKDNVDKELTVRPAKEMQIVGVYKTRLDGATTEALTTYYAYLVDADGTAIKLVSQGKDFPAGFYAAGDWKLPVNGFVGDFRYTYGSPEIVVNSKSAPYHDLLGTPVAGRIDGYNPVLPERLEITTTPTDKQFVTDFNRKVVVRNLTWLRSNNEVADEKGNRYQIYSRLVVRDAQGADLDADVLTSDMFTSDAGTKWLVEGFVGQVNGKTAIFPTAKVRPCPVRPTLYAPNEIDGDVNVISDEFTVTLSKLPEGMEARYSFDADVKSGDVVPAEGLVIRKADFTDGVRDLYVYTYDKSNDVWSLRASHVKFHAYDAKEAKSIAEFKEVFLGHEKDWFDTDGVLTKQAIADNNLSLYYQLSGKAVVIKRTPEYLYLRDLNPTDGTDFSSANYLMVHNGKAWEQPKVDNTDADAAEGAKRVLRPGDVIHGVALMANLTPLGNLRSETTNFARTVVYDNSIDSTSVAAREVKVSYEEGGDIYYEDINLGDTDRMMYLTLKGVEVTDESRDTERYFLRIGDGSVPVRLSFDIFTVRSGWSTAYKKGSLYDITGVFMRDGEDGFALAMTDFGGLAGDTEEPQLFLAGHPDLAGNEVQAGLHDLQFEMTVPEGAIGYYAIGGANPLHNVAERHTYTAGEKVALTFDEGQDRVVVMAFAAEPGKTPSEVVTRTFVKSTREMSYLLNFINQGVQGDAYHFNSAVRIVSVSGQNMFVRGSVGHYLPIYNADGWDVTKYREGEYVSDFVMIFDAADGNRRGVVNAECSWPEKSVALEDYPDDNMKEITITPDEVDDISAENARRLVTVSNVVVNVNAPENARAATPTITFKSAIDGSVAHLLNTAELGELDGVDFEDGAYYDITGFVMLNGTEVELWPTDAKRIPMTADVTVQIDGKSISPVADGEYLEYAESFYPATKVKLECSNHLSTTRIYYSYDNKEWFTYGEPFIVTASQSCIHAYAVAEGRRPSRHTHIALTRLEPSGDVDFELAPDETKGVTMVTLKALGGAKDSDIRWSKDNFATAGKEYTGPIEIAETCILYARVEEEGKVAGETVHALVIVPAVKQDEPQKPVDPEQPDQPENPDQPDQPENPDQPGQAVSGKVKFEITEDEATGKVYVTISPAEAIAGGYEIYWTDRMGTLTPDNGTPYDFQPIEVTETTYIMAILVETGKKSGAVCGVNVWVNPTPTAIDGINGDRDADAVRADGDRIIAPEGSVVYDLNGRRVRGEGLRQGIYLVRTPDGSTVKVMIR